jgi:hypothetical protein
MAKKRFRIKGSLTLESNSTEPAQTLQVDEVIEAENEEDAVDKLKAKYESKYSATFQPAYITLQMITVTEEKSE